MKKLLITSRSFGKLSPEPMDMLIDAGFAVENMGHDFDMERFETALPEYDALIIGAHKLAPELLERCPKLKIICKHGVGVDNIPLEAAAARGIAVTNTPGTNSEAVADLAFGLMLDIARNITKSACHLRSGNNVQDMGLDVHRKSLGLMGFGRIAQAVARRAAGFQMQVLAYDPYIQTVPEDLSFVKLASKETVLRDSDFISIHLPLIPETINFISKEEIEIMKPEAFLINTARGGIVDEDALYEALVRNRLRAAALDVTKEEPTQPTNRLLTLENIVITNHIGMYSREAVTAVSRLCAEAVRDLFAGRQPKNLVRA